jgi:hypothetical protein
MRVKVHLDFRKEFFQKILSLSVVSSIFFIILLSLFSIPIRANLALTNIFNIDLNYQDHSEPEYIPVFLGAAIPISAAFDMGELVLHWTAPGDDGYTGQAAGYDLRYQPSELGEIDTGQEWQTAIQVQGEPQPSPSGHTDSMVVTDLEFGASYYFCIKTYDEAGNFSDLSNSPLLTVEVSCFVVNINTVGCGAVYLNPDEECYHYGDTVIMTAEPCDYSDFSGWSGDIEGIDNPKTLVVTDNINVTATFTSDFIPGDANGNGQLQVSDITFLINYFKGIGPMPDPFLAGDANGDCSVEGSDVTYILAYFRGNGPAPIIGDCEPPQ